MTDAQSKSPRRRRWFQFSLRTFLVLMLLSSLGLGWLGTAIQRGRERRKAVLAIGELGGSVSYFGPSNVLQRSDWLRKLLGDDAILDVQLVVMNGCDLEDANLVHLRVLTQLRYLELERTQVTDAGLVFLEGLSQLSFLTLRDTQVTHAGLVHLKGLTNLQHLSLANTHVSDADLIHLTGLSNLRFLDLSNTQVTDAGLVHLTAMCQLAGVHLNNTQVSDAGLVHFKAMSKLTELRIEGTRVTEEGIDELDLPNCSIYWNPLPSPDESK